MWLGLESETRLRGRGVSACATCDGFFFRDKEIAVVGGGDTALEEATYLTRFATKVHLLHRRDEFRGSKIMVDRALENPKIEIHYQHGRRGGPRRAHVEGLRLRDTATGAERVLPADGLFIAIGHRPNTEAFRDWLEVDAKGYLVVHDETGSKIDGVFIAGDVHDHRYRQAVTAAGDGCKAAIDAERWLEVNGLDIGARAAERRAGRVSAARRAVGAEWVSAGAVAGRAGLRAVQARASVGRWPIERSWRPEGYRVPPERRGQTLRRIAAFFQPYKAQVAIVLVAILATSLLGLINPFLLKLLIDDVIVGHQYDKLNLYVGLMIVMPIVSGLIGVGQTYLNNVIGQSVMQDLRAALYAHLQKMPLRFFTETRTGEIQSRLANDVGGVQSVVTDTGELGHEQPGHRDLDDRGDVPARLAADRPVARPAAVLHVPHVPRRQGPARGVDGDPEVAGRHLRAHRGDAERHRDAAVQDVRPAGPVDHPVPRPQQDAWPCSRSARRWSAAGSS